MTDLRRKRESSVNCNIKQEIVGLCCALVWETVTGNDMQHFPSIDMFRVCAGYECV